MNNDYRNRKLRLEFARWASATSIQALLGSTRFATPLAVIFSVLVASAISACNLARQPSSTTLSITTTSATPTPTFGPCLTPNAAVPSPLPILSPAPLAAWGNATLNPVTVSWAANHELAVNSPVGGYQVYYSSNKAYQLSQANYVSVPYNPALGQTPTSTVLYLPAGTFYIKVVAYSNPTCMGAPITLMSSPSSTITVAVP